MMMMMMPALKYVGMLLTLPLLILSESPAEVPEPGSRDQWWELGQAELKSALSERPNYNVAKNVIVFLGDGMGLSTVTAARIYKGQKEGASGEEGYLIWERFPHSALIKTYSTSNQVPDSAATATALFTGVKARSMSLGLVGEVESKDCAASQDPANHLTSILKWAQDAGLDTGIVTRTEVTDATPGSLYAKIPYRFWKCDTALGEKGKGCKDIADQLATDEPGSKLKVIMGGGRYNMGAGVATPSQKSCVRSDGRNLVKEWMADKTKQGFQARYVTTKKQLMKTKARKTDYLIGLFADENVPFVVENKKDVPSLSDMTRKAVEVLSKSSEGFFLLVEGGRIDHGLHFNSPWGALEEALDFEAAVTEALKMVDQEETLVIVTADHSHTLTISGYPQRGNDILGTTEEVASDGVPMSTLSFANGPGYATTFTVQNGKVVRADPSTMDPRSPTFMSQVTVPLGYETHAGEDVGLWAKGPMSHLFHRTHEQNYVAHAMAYAACVGNNFGFCKRPTHSTFTRPGTNKRPAIRDMEPGHSMMHGGRARKGLLDLDDEELVRLVRKPMIRSPRKERPQKDPNPFTDYYHPDL